MKQDTTDYLDEVYPYLERATRYDKYIAGLCPFHIETRPSFFVYPHNYFCSSCGAKGSTKGLARLLQQKHGVYFQKPTNYKNPWTNWLDYYGDIKVVIDKAHRFLLSRSKFSYLESRGIDRETIEKLHVGWLDDWITFPITNIAGEVIGGTARAGETNKSEAKYTNPAGQDSNLLYVPSWKIALAKDRLILVFGIIDAISLYQLGYASASTTTGKRISSEVFDNIRKPILIIPDHGEEIEAARLSASLGWRGRVAKVDWMEDEKDVNNIFVKDRERLIRIIEENYGCNIA